MKEVPPGEVVITAEIADFDRLDPNASRWRLYFVGKLASAITDALDSEKWDIARRDFEGHTVKHGWGALVWAISHSSINSLSAVSARLTGVLASWEELDTLRYLHATPDEVSLAELVERHFHDFVTLWVERPGGDVRKDLSQALERARHASRQQVVDALVPRLLEIARTYDPIRNKEALADRARIATWLAALDEADLQEMETGHGSELRRQLYILDESLQG